MNDQHPSAETYTGSDDGVIVVEPGPVGCTAALLLADQGVPVTLLERHTQPHPLPRAVHLDDEVARTLYRAGVSDEFLARSRSCSGLRLLNAGHRVMAEFRREHAIGIHGFPQANMFHQPDLEQLLLARVEQHPLINFHRGVQVTGMDGTFGPLTGGPVEVHAEARTRRARANVHREPGAGLRRRQQHDPGPVRDHHGRPRVHRALARDRYPVRQAPRHLGRRGADLRPRPGRHLHAGHRPPLPVGVPAARRRRRSRHDHPGRPRQALGALDRAPGPDGLEIIRSATYTFRARLASRFQTGRVFLLGDAAHLTPPFIGQGLAAGLRDADNLAWKIAHVLTGQAGEDLLASYEAERRPHARAMINKAVRVGWAMTGGQDRAAAVRRIALAAAVRSDRAREVIASTATPRLKTGALHQRPPLLRPRTPATVRPGGLIANPLVSIRADAPIGDGAPAGEGAPVRLDAVLRGRTAVLTARPPEPGLVDLCRRHGLLLVKISAPATAGDSAPAPGPQTARGWADVRLAGHGGATPLQALISDPTLSVVVRPDRVIAAVATGSRLPRLPWGIPAATAPAAGRMIASSQT